MKRGTRRFSIVWLCAVFALTVAPTELRAGGGSSGGAKGRALVRIKNTSTGVTSSPLVALDTVEVGDAGNSATTIEGVALGAVAQTFRIGKTEVTIAHYVAFLNAVAKRSDGANGAVIESLYDSRMETDLNVAGIARVGAGTEASPYVYSALGDSSKPIAYVTWFNAARFANWMHNGATESADIENGAYPLNGTLSGIIAKNPTAIWWIPSEDEWFKSAYYKSGGVNAGYWRYPTQSDDFPGNSSSSNTNNANFLRNSLFSVTQNAALDANQNYLTTVTTFGNSPSAYGTFDQGGNLDEWTDGIRSTGFGVARITRGGAWNSGGLNTDATPASTALPNDRSSKFGFRLARVANQESAGALSGTFLVKVGPADSTPQQVAPDQVVQFTVRLGTFTVEAQDAINPNVRVAKDFSVQGNRTTRLTIDSADGTITIARAEPEATF